VTVLLDAKVLIARVVANHVHHQRAEAWLATAGNSFAACPMTQASLIRLLLREGQPAATAIEVLSVIRPTERSGRHRPGRPPAGAAEMALRPPGG